MTATTAILGLLAQTSIHAGAGSQTGIIDLPIQREGHNGWPCVFGSAVKGALRDRAEQQIIEGKPADKSYEDIQKDDAIVSVYGAPPKQSGESSAGAIIVTDARLLLFPVRSLTSQFKWVTCPDALRRYLADSKRLGLPVDFDVSELANIGENQAIIHNVSDNNQPSQPKIHNTNNADSLFLEEYRFVVEPPPKDLCKVISALVQLMQRDDAKQALKNQLVIVSNDNFTHLVNHATPVNAHIALDALTKTTQGGALWYEETLPPETLLYIGLSANASRQEKPTKENPRKTAEEVLKSGAKYFQKISVFATGRQ